MCVCLCVCMCVSVCMCARKCEHVCVHVCMCARKCEHDQEVMHICVVSVLTCLHSFLSCKTGKGGEGGLIVQM